MRHVNSVFSRGVGYENTPIGSNIDSDAVRGYYIDFTAKTVSPSATAPQELVPAGLAQLALGWWERLLAGDAHAEQHFLDACDLLEKTSSVESDARVWYYAIPLRKYRLPAGWMSALAQAQAASVFVRAAAHTQDDRYAGLALAAIRPLVAHEPPTLLAQIAEGPVPEECPSEPPSLILNGWIYALWGLRDVAVGLGAEQARSTYYDSLGCLLAVLPRYDVGWWTRYSLYPFRLPDLAKIFYHRLHIAQADLMGHLTSERAFFDAAARWRAYDAPAKRLALVAQKTAFVAAGYR